MSHFRPCLTLLLASLVNSTGCSIEKGTSSNGVELTATAPTTTASGTPVIVEFVLRNNSASEIQIATSGGLSELGIRVTDTAGQFAPATKLGHGQVRQDPLSDPLDGSSWNIPLAAGASHSWHVDLSTLYDLKPGHYLLSVRIWISNPKSFFLELKDMELDISRP